MTTHQWVGYRVTRDPVTHSACCSCGWNSKPMSTAGLAASLWDLHQAENGGKVPLVAPEGVDHAS